MSEDDKALVERLRAGCPTYVENMSNGRPGTISGDTVAAAKLLAEAADRITQLSAEVERLNKAIGHYELALKASKPHGASGPCYDNWNAARAAINAMKGPTNASE